MRTAKSVAGPKRAYFSIQTSISAEEMAIHWLNYDIALNWIEDLEAHPEIKRLAREIGERKLMNAVKNSILSDGDEIPSYKIGDALPDGSLLVESIASIFTERFGLD